MESNNYVNGVIVEYVEGIEVIKAFNQSSSSYEKFTKAVKSFKDYTLKWYQSTWKVMNFVSAVLPSTFLGTLPIGMYLYWNGKRFAENVKKAEAAGMPWGAYLYSYAKNTSMAKSEAEHALRLLKGKTPLYGVWYDVEDPQISGVDVVATSQTFCDAMENAGYYAGIYASLSWLNNQLGSSKLDKYDKWVAQWNSSCTYKKAYGIWQYTDKLVIGGKNFDGNWAYKDYPSIIKAMNGETEEEDDEMLTYDQWKDYMERYEQEKAKEKVSSWAKDAVEFVQKEGLMNGDADGSFRPQSNVTRQELAAVLKNEHDK